MTSYPLGWLLSKKKITSVGKEMEKLEPLTVVGTKNGAVAMENNMDGRFLKKIKIKLPYHPPISFLSQKN